MKVTAAVFFVVQLSKYYVIPRADGLADHVASIREAYLILYYIHCFFHTVTLLVSRNQRKKTNLSSDVKRDNTESVYDEFLSTELSTEDEA
jgi:hypothetical protein